MNNSKHMLQKPAVSVTVRRVSRVRVNVRLVSGRIRWRTQA